MLQLLTVLTTGFVTFIATNIDDLLILIFLFSQGHNLIKPYQIVTGQYLGFTLLILLSISGLLGTFLIPSAWVRILGIIPILLGLACLLKGEDEEDNNLNLTLENQPKPSSFIPKWLSSQTFVIAAVTVANGSDNIGVYVPLFANTELLNLPIILGIFFSLVGVWCYLAYRLTNVPAIASIFSGYGQTFVPCVLMSLGVFILKENVSLALLTLAGTYLWSVAFTKNNLKGFEIANHLPTEKE